MGRFLKFLLGLALLVYLAPVLAGAFLVAWVFVAELFGNIGP